MKCMEQYQFTQEIIESGSEKELSQDDKKNFSQMWIDLFVDCEKMPEHVEDLSESEIREWMFQSLMHDVKRLLFEWNLEPDEKLIGDIMREDDPQIKAQLEKRYILEMHKRFTAKIATCDDKGKSAKWSSWPQEMRAQGLCNCVGASSLGIDILETAGITSYYGNPAGHIVNIARLSDGKWWYVDFLNGSTQCKEINAQEVTINSVTALKVDDIAIDYHLIVYGDTQNMPAFIINNIIGMDYEASDDAIPDTDMDKIFAKSYLAKNRVKMSSPDKVKIILKKLFPDIDKIQNSPEMQTERIRIRELYGAEGESAQAFMRSLTDGEEELIKRELAKNSDSVERLLCDQDVTIYHTTSKNTTELLRRLVREVNKVGEISQKKKIIKIEAILEMINAL